VMGYIIDLTVILHNIFGVVPGDVSASDIQLAVDRHVRSGLRNRIHQEISSFVAETFAIIFTVPQRDPILERIAELIQQYCFTA